MDSSSTTHHFQVPVDINDGLSDEQALKVASHLEFTGAALNEVSPAAVSLPQLSLLLKAAGEIRKLYNLFIGVDATQVEINPFGETPEGRGQWNELLKLLLLTCASLSCLL